MANMRTASGGRIDRAKPVNFSFDGVAYQGARGDTLASALIANGVHLMGRSFKYHRPRGLVSMGTDEPNALVGVSRDGGRSTPNLRASEVELYEGLTAISQNRFPSLKFDVGAVNSLLSPIFAAGFYYKTFMFPKLFWHTVYEPVIRRAAGLGNAAKEPDPDHYANRFAHCDVLVVGAGPAGLTAALAAAESGADVIICDEGAEFGGSLLSAGTATIDGREANQWPLDIFMVLAMHANIRALPRTTAFGYYQQNFVGLCERITDHLADAKPGDVRERMWQVRAKQVVLATGAIERPLVFADNDRPGVMLASSARILLNRFGVKCGTRAVVFTVTDDAYQTALELHDAGVQIAAIVDMRADGGTLGAQAEGAGIRVIRGAVLTGTKGGLRVSGACVGKLDGETVTPLEDIECDVILHSGGWTPNVNLFSQSRGKLQYDARGLFVPGVAAQDMASVGACNGTFDLTECLNAGYATGEAAARAVGKKAGTLKTFDALGDVALSAGISGAVPTHKDAGKIKAFVDFQNDVTAKDIMLATREGMRSIEHVKRYTTTGMATDQGKTSNINALTTVAALTGRPIPEIGLTTFRPPYTPVTFGTFSGPARDDLYDPIRRTPIDDRDAVFEHTGGWFRARYFPINTETIAHATARECEAVRSDLGLFDASTLGKIDVAGPDAAEFLDRIYTGTFKTLATGRCKYALLLGEDGFIRDDGVIARLAPDRFHVTTTSGGAASVLHHMEDYLQTEFAELDVHLTGITEQFACIALQGPRSAEALAAFLDDIDLTTMPHMSIREGHFAGTPIRLMRVSFTGEPGYELIIPASYAQSAWELLRTTGATRYGTETMHILRAEKGFFIAGQETDGTVIPADLGLTGMIATGKGDFVGKRSLSRPDMIRTGRPKLVGLLTKDPTIILEEGAQIVLDTPKSIGFVTSAYHSTALNRSIALALVNNGRALIGATAHVPMHGTGIAVTITKPVFYDPTGARMTQPVTITPRARTATLTRAPFARPASAPCPLAEITILPFTAKTLIQTPAENALTLGPTEALSFNPGQNGVDLSDALIGLAIIGPKAAWCLNAFCPLDLDTLSIGAATRTIFGKAPIILWRRAENHFQLEIARSFTPYVWSCLEEARREFRTSATPC